MAQRILGELPVEGALLEDILKCEPISPAYLAKGARVVELVGAAGAQDVNDTIRMTIDGDLRALGKKGPGKSKNRIKEGSDVESSTALPFDVEVINADQDIVNLAASLESGAGARICLYGPPGTGKTAWSRHLAKQLGKHVRVVQGADIFDKYLGESEKAIKKAFRKAHKNNAVLVFDEADSFLQNRQWAQQQYEIKFVNQFLLCMENFGGVMVCTTNLMDGLDQATLRRFDWKIKFDYLSEEQAIRLFESMVSTVGLDIHDPAIREQLGTACRTLSGCLVTPGDFAVVLRKSALQQHRANVEQLMKDLLIESQFREETPTPGIGFLAQL